MGSVVNDVRLGGKDKEVVVCVAYVNYKHVFVSVSRVAAMEHCVCNLIAISIFCINNALTQILACPRIFFCSRREPYRTEDLSNRLNGVYPCSVRRWRTPFLLTSMETLLLPANFHSEAMAFP